jgi:hypothetical protein
MEKKLHTTPEQISRIMKRRLEAANEPYWENKLKDAATENPEVKDNLEELGQIIRRALDGAEVTSPDED